VINSKKSIALVDSTKFNKDSSSTFCTFEEVDILITDANLDKSIEQQFDSRIKIIKADS
jgi:DeoR/GlpR family transcriptional regulator of sugar metabolism